MTEQERESQRDKANIIALEVLPDIRTWEAKAYRAVERPLEPVPRGMPWLPSMNQIEEMAAHLNEADALRKQAREKIEREVIDPLPPDATENDKNFIRGEAYKILGIPSEPQKEPINLRDMESLSPEFDERAAREEREPEPDDPEPDL